MKSATPYTPTHAGGLGRRSPKGQGGFTLIELLVALTILAIMLSTIYATFFSALKAMRASRERDDTYQVARVVMERIANDLAMACSRPPFPTSRTCMNPPRCQFIATPRYAGAADVSCPLSYTQPSVPQECSFQLNPTPKTGAFIFRHSREVDSKSIGIVIPRL